MIDPIAKLRSATGSLLSVYVNRRPPATRAALSQLLKDLRHSTDDDRSTRTDISRILDMAPEIERSGAPATAIFASHRDGIFEVLPLAHTVDEVAAIGPRPHLRPLRAEPRPLRVGVLVADAGHARTYLANGGGLREIGQALTADRGKENFGGFAGYEEQRIRARAEEVSAAMWRQAGRRLLDEHRDQPLELLLLVGREEDFDSIAAALHPYLQELSQARVRADIRTLTAAELVDHVSREMEKDRTRRHEELTAHLLAEAGRDGAAVLGVAPVLDACNAHAVEHLVVAGPFAKPGFLCDGCGHLSRAEDECPVCRQATFPISDILSAAMDATVEAGGKVDVVTVASPLDAAGAGALLRFRMG